MTGLEPLVVGYLVKWVTDKARRIGKRVDDGVDHILDASVDELVRLVLNKLGEDQAVAQLQEDATNGVDNERTRTRVQLALEEATEQDTEFADQLTRLTREANTTSTGSNVVINAHAEGNAQMPVQGSGVMHNVFGRQS